MIVQQDEPSALRSGFTFDVGIWGTTPCCGLSQSFGNQGFDGAGDEERERERVAGMESWYSGSTTTVKAYLEAHATWSVRVGESIRRIPGISRRHPRDQLDHQATTGNQDTARTPAKMFAPVY